LIIVIIGFTSLFQCLRWLDVSHVHRPPPQRMRFCASDQPSSKSVVSFSTPFRQALPPSSSYPPQPTLRTTTPNLLSPHVQYAQTNPTCHVQQRSQHLQCPDPPLTSIILMYPTPFFPSETPHIHPTIHPPSPQSPHIIDPHSLGLTSTRQHTLHIRSAHSLLQPQRHSPCSQDRCQSYELTPSTSHSVVFLTPPPSPVTSPK
jgi:hypothetical protein